MFRLFMGSVQVVSSFSNRTLKPKGESGRVSKRGGLAANRRTRQERTTEERQSVVEKGAGLLKLGSRLQSYGVTHLVFSVFRQLSSC